MTHRAGITRRHMFQHPTRRVRRLLAGATFAGLCAFATLPAWALGERALVRFDTAPGAVILARDGAAARIVVDGGEDPAVHHAAASLQDDIARVSGVRPSLLAALPDGAAAQSGQGDLVLVGTLGH